MEDRCITGPLFSMSGSASQCHNCRKRRIRCDSTQPACKKCAVKGLECLGYGKQKPLVWLQDGGYQNQWLSESSKPASQRKPRKSGRPRLIVAKDESPPTRSALVPTNLADSQNQPRPSYILQNLVVKYPMDINLAVSSLWYCKCLHLEENTRRLNYSSSTIPKSVPMPC